MQAGKSKICSVIQQAEDTRKSSILAPVQRQCDGEFPLAGGLSFFLEFRPLTDLIMPTHIKEGNLPTQSLLT
jgi:hypothetical protein